ncbi:MAG: hypothetical protein MMC33_008733 [Icmadophila ericetorum]|nr:hypothetical protein [Icmadophila ericetorum]
MSTHSEIKLRKSAGEKHLSDFSNKHICLAPLMLVCAVICVTNTKAKTAAARRYASYAAKTTVVSIEGRNPEWSTCVPTSQTLSPEAHMKTTPNALFNANFDVVHSSKRKDTHGAGYPFTTSNSKASSRSHNRSYFIDSPTRTKVHLRPKSRMMPLHIELLRRFAGSTGKNTAETTHRPSDTKLLQNALAGSESENLAIM